MACDGIWDVITDAEAGWLINNKKKREIILLFNLCVVRVVRGTKDPCRAAGLSTNFPLISILIFDIFRLVRLRDMAIGRNSKDNVSVIVIQVKKTEKSSFAYLFYFSFLFRS